MEILARAVGRRKEAVAQVQLVRGNGQFLINDKPAQAYLQNNSCSLICIKAPLQAALSLSANSLVPTQEREKNVSGEEKLEEGSEEISIIASSNTEDAKSLLESKPDQVISSSLNLGELSFQLSEGEINIIVKVKGGGLIGQAEAIKLGVARAFCIMENVSGGTIVRKILKTKGFLTQDSRVKERRKYGLKKARKASQYHKR